MQAESSLAYSMSQIETGWTWCVYDEDGITVAEGAGDSQEAARADVLHTLGTASRPTGG